MMKQIFSIVIVLVLVAVTVFLCTRLTPELGQSVASVKMELPSSLAGYTGEDGLPGQGWSVNSSRVNHAF